MRDSNSIDVYYSPVSTHETVGEWSLLYPEPTTLFNELASKRTPNAGQDTFFSCPATNDKFRKTFVVKSAIDCSYYFDFTSDNQSDHYFTQTSSNYIGYEIRRPPTVSFGPTISFSLRYSFFASEPLEAVFTPPMMHKPQHTMYGSSVPGQFDIGRWFRPYPLEMQMWSNKGEFHFVDDEPLLYVEFKTKKKINFVRYKMNSEIEAYLNHCSTSKGLFGAGLSLERRYEKFETSRMRDQVLRAIRAQVLDCNV
jgi:hypothetical protein